MKKHIKIIALLVLVIALFVGSFFFGESGEVKDDQNIYVTEKIKEEQPIIE